VGELRRRAARDHRRRAARSGSTSRDGGTELGWVWSRTDKGEGKKENRGEKGEKEKQNIEKKGKCKKENKIDKRYIEKWIKRLILFSLQFHLEFQFQI
jgi:hypothetical protein